MRLYQLLRIYIEDIDVFSCFSCKNVKGIIPIHSKVGINTHKKGYPNG
jgi:hypothetical protein